MLNLQDILVAASIVSLIIFWRQKPFRDFSNKVQGINGYPFIGGLYEFFGIDHKDMYTKALEMSRKFESSFKFWAGPLLVLIVKDADDIKIALNSIDSFEKPPRFYKPFFVHTLFTISGNVYKIRRRAISPLFHPATLKGFLPIINSKMQGFLERFDSKVESNAIDISLYAMDFTLDTLLATMFGRNDIGDDVRRKFVHDFEQIFSMTSERIFQPWLCFDSIFRFHKNYKPLMKYKKDTIEFVDKILEDAERNYQQKSFLGDNRSPYLESLYKIRDTMTYEEVREEVAFFFVAGFDTTGKAIPGILLLLAMNQEVQEKLFGEIMKAVSQDCDEIEEEKIFEMEFLGQVIKESMRLLPVALMFGRVVTNDLELTNYTAPPGTILLFYTLETHTNKKYWGDDALEFKPERFSEENFKKVHPYAYFPFSRGQRMCPGNRYAWMAMRVFLSKFLMKYRVTTELKYDELEFQLELTMNLKQGFMIKVERR